MGKVHKETFKEAVRIVYTALRNAKTAEDMKSEKFFDEIRRIAEVMNGRPQDTVYGLAYRVGPTWYLSPKTYKDYIIALDEWTFARFDKLLADGLETILPGGVPVDDVIIVEMTEGSAEAVAKVLKHQSTER
jgi:hypothetical protein